jgi:Flp pilus assembly pilin Flp
LATLWSRDEEDGQGLAEYALILGLIAVVAIVSLIFLGDTVADLMSMIGNTIDQST